MTQGLNSNEIKDFVRLFHHCYSKETLLPEICNVTLYQENISETYGEIGDRGIIPMVGEKGHSSLEYNQIGQRTLMPVEAFDPTRSLDIIQSDAHGLGLGERRYVLDQLDKKAKRDEIDTLTFDEPDRVNFQEWCSQVRRPNHLFLPLDEEFHRTVFDWQQRNDYNLGVDEVAVSGQSIVKIHWVPLDTGIEHGYLFNSEGLNIVQKWFGDSPDPTEFSYNPKYNALSENRPLMVYIGDEIIEDEDGDNFTEKVEFLYRIVVSELTLNSNHVVRLQPTKPLSND